MPTRTVRRTRTTASTPRRRLAQSHASTNPAATSSGSTMNPVTTNVEAGAMYGRLTFRARESTVGRQEREAHGDGAADRVRAGEPGSARRLRRHHGDAQDRLGQQLL